jgi:hypothetical protein
MKPTNLFILTCAFLVAPLSAQQLQVETGGPAAKALDWSAAQWWETQPSRVEGIRLGKSDYRVRGPVVDVFRKAAPPREKRSWRQRFFGLPFVSPLAAKTSNTPIQRTDYFAWGERAVSWSTLADRPIPGPQCALLTVSR